MDSLLDKTRERLNKWSSTKARIRALFTGQGLTMSVSGHVELSLDAKFVKVVSETGELLARFQFLAAASTEPLIDWPEAILQILCQCLITRAPN